IRDGLAQVVVGEGVGRRTVARLRRGEVVGEMSLITGEPRSATVVANVPTELLVLNRDTFASLLVKYPTILANLNRILSRRLAERNLRHASRGRGTVVALVAGRAGAAFVPPGIAATKAASRRSVVALDL